MDYFPEDSKPLLRRHKLPRPDAIRFISKSGEQIDYQHEPSPRSSAAGTLIIFLILGVILTLWRWLC